MCKKKVSQIFKFKKILIKHRTYSSYLFFELKNAKHFFVLISPFYINMSFALYGNLVNAFFKNRITIFAKSAFFQFSNGCSALII